MGSAVSGHGRAEHGAGRSSGLSTIPEASVGSISSDAPLLPQRALSRGTALLGGDTAIAPTPGTAHKAQPAGAGWLAWLGRRVSQPLLPLLRHQGSSAVGDVSATSHHPPLSPPPAKSASPSTEGRPFAPLLRHKPGVPAAAAPGQPPPTAELLRARHSPSSSPRAAGQLPAIAETQTEAGSELGAGSEAGAGAALGAPGPGGDSLELVLASQRRGERLLARAEGHLRRMRVAGDEAEANHEARMVSATVHACMHRLNVHA